MSFNIKMNFRKPHSGITIVEVLTAMVVAMIGVFGVMVLIPFAVKQSETGLDLDDAFRIARNGIAQFEIGGHNRLVNDQAPWFSDDLGTRVASADVFSIDPLSIHGNMNTFNRFPPTNSVTSAGYSITPGDLAYVPAISEVNIGTYVPNGTPELQAISDAVARDIFLSKDDLTYNDPIDDLSPPQPIFNQFYDSVATDFQAAERQANGELSWNAIVVPVKDDYASIAPISDPTAAAPDDRFTGGWKFRMFMLVHSNRVTNRDRMRMPVARVVRPQATATETSVPYVDPASGTPPNQEIIVGTGTTITLDRQIANVQKNDWLMLINEDPDLEVGFQKQIGFFRILGTGIDSADSTLGTITIDGSDFSFRTETESTMAHIRTYAVLLVNFDDSLSQRLGRVINVYERTFQLEQDSNWAK